MAHPTQKRTKSSKRKRNAGFSLKKASLIKCPQCGRPTPPHQACQFCGRYRGRQVIKLKNKQKTAQQRDKERRQKTREKEAEKQAKKDQKTSEKKNNR